MGEAVLRNIRDAGFAGQFGIVNPRHAEIDRQKTWPTLSALPFVPELIVITAPPATIPAIIAEAGARGVAGAVILSAGLGHGDASVAGATLAAARIAGVRLIGPNCLGLMIPGHKLNASFAAHAPREGSLALISQSGAIAAAMVDWAAQRPIGFSGIVSIGDQLDVDIADCLDFFALDQKTRAILLYVESVSDARKFMSAARAASRLKPVVVVKAGRRAQGAKAAASHTGALAGSDAVYDAAFRRAGMLRVFDLRELFDCAEVLANNPTAEGKRLAILTNGGGLGILATDRLVDLGGLPAELSDTVKAELDAALPPGWSKANPVDIAGDADPARYQAALSILLADPGNDGVLVLNVETAVADAAEIANAVAATVATHREKGSLTSGKPVLASFVGAEARIVAALDRVAIPQFPTEDDAVRAFMYGVRYSEAMHALTAVPASTSGFFEADTVKARKIVETALRDGHLWLDPIEVAELLQAYRIPVVPACRANDAEQAVAQADVFFKQGLAVTLKILSPDIVHKSDVGGVVLNIIDVAAVRRAFDDMLTRIKKACPTAVLDGVIVQPMIARPKARELIMGLADDPTFGPVIAFGRGGTAVEITNDKALALPPLDMNLARDLIERTAIARLLKGYRDVPAVKTDEVALTLLKLSQMAIDLPEVRELDINPLLADETGVIALDARVMVRAPQKLFAGKTRLAIRPYPVAWQKNIRLDDGRRIMVRPIRPEDEPAIRNFLERTDAMDIRMRFFNAVKEFSHPFIARLTQIDYARAMAFCAIDPATQDIVGVVRLHSDASYETAEYAVLLRSDQKGHGLGWALMTFLITYARAEGLKELTGQVLQENTAMLKMCGELGFSVKSDREEASIANVTLDLTR